MARKRKSRSRKPTPMRKGTCRVAKNGRKYCRLKNGKVVWKKKGR